MINSDIPLKSEQWNRVEATGVINGFTDNGSDESYILRVDLKESESGSMSFSNLKAEFSSVATPFVPDDPATNLAKCQRYYQHGSALVTSNNELNHKTLPVTMRKIPAVAVSQGVISDVMADGFNVRNNATASVTFTADAEL